MDNPVFAVRSHGHLLHNLSGQESRLFMMVHSRAVSKFTQLLGRGLYYFRVAISNANGQVLAQQVNVFITRLVVYVLLVTPVEDDRIVVGLECGKGRREIFVPAVHDVVAIAFTPLARLLQNATH